MKVAPGGFQTYARMCTHKKDTGIYAHADTHAHTHTHRFQTPSTTLASSLYFSISQIGIKHEIYFKQYFKP